MPDHLLDLVVRHRKGQTYGVHALIAALEVEPPSVPSELHLARTVDEVAGRVREGVDAGTACPPTRYRRRPTKVTRGNH